jgi:hypothetical protein
MPFENSLIRRRIGTDRVDNMSEMAGPFPASRSAIRKTQPVTKPILQALVLADHVYQDRITGKMIIAGTFTRVVSVRPSQPADFKGPLAASGVEGADKQLDRISAENVGTVGSPYAYMCLTGIHTSAELEMRYVDLRTYKPLFRAALTVQCDNPLRAVELGIRLPMPLPMPHNGEYSLELLCEEEMLGSWRVSATTEDAGPLEDER